MPKASFLADPVPTAAVPPPAIANFTGYSIPLDRIDNLDPVTQVRSRLDSDESIREFAAQLKAEGMAQPILVRPGAGDMFNTVAGHRRVCAALLNGDTHILAYIRDCDDATARRLAFEENYRRKQFSPIDLAKLFLEARGENYQPNWSERVSKQFGVSRATVTEAIKMYEGLAGDQELIDQVHSGELAADAAILLAKQKGEVRAAQLAEAKRLAEAEETRKRMDKKYEASKRRAGKAAQASPPPRKAQDPVQTPSGAPEAGETAVTPASKPAKVRAKHVKAAALAAGQKALGPLNRSELIDGLLHLVDPSYPACMNAFLNYTGTDWQSGKGTMEILKNHWRGIACVVDVKTPGCEESPTGRTKSLPELQNIPTPLVQTAAQYAETVKMRKRLGMLDKKTAPAKKTAAKKTVKPAAKKAVKKTAKKK